MEQAWVASPSLHETQLLTVFKLFQLSWFNSFSYNKNNNKQGLATIFLTCILIYSFQGSLEIRKVLYRSFYWRLQHRMQQCVTQGQQGRQQTWNSSAQLTVIFSGSLSRRQSGNTGTTSPWEPVCLWKLFAPLKTVDQLIWRSCSEESEPNSTFKVLILSS